MSRVHNGGQEQPLQIIKGRKPQKKPSSFEDIGMELIAPFHGSLETDFLHDAMENMGSIHEMSDFIRGKTAALSLNIWRRLLSLETPSMMTFSPDDGPFESKTSPEGKLLESEKSNSCSESETDRMDDDLYLDWQASSCSFSSQEDDNRYDELPRIPIKVEPELAEDLALSPRILTRSMMQQLADCGLPSTVRIKRWVRLYSVARDGDSFGTFVRLVEGFSDTIIVAQTVKGEIVGGFADAPWGRLRNQRDGSFYGTGGSFLFCTKPRNTHKRKPSRYEASRFKFTGSPQRRSSFRSSRQQGEEEVLTRSPKSTIMHLPDPSVVGYIGGDDNTSERIEIYKWSGKNYYNQLCHTREGLIAMGGGGSEACFGLCIQDNFTHGTTGPCDTYGTDRPLTAEEHFEIVDFEVYGFVNGW